MPSATEQPTITLRFSSLAAKEYFMSQLSDGWGENFVELAWPWTDGVAFDDVEVFDVKVIDLRTDEVIP